ncbi:multiple epidermal growth factor-like domains protein 10 [Mya arenaria]|nr:multiple epidermal growth factor-like domains protein 10 [Mya arenaria]
MCVWDFFRDKLVDKYCWLGLRCLCCIGGNARCDQGNGYCYDGCVNGQFGNTCNTPCPGNCSTCSRATGCPCYSCKTSFYDTTSACSKKCPVGCDRGACYENGTCSQCTANFEGTKCETCIQGKYGSDCTHNCTHHNCRCSTETDCTSCKTGFYGRSTFCQTPCSPGCHDGVCNNDGSCKCRSGFTESTCSACQSGYYGAYCNVSCSEGCVNGLCSDDGTCSCRPNFVTAKCDACADGRYGVNCDRKCSVGCTTSLWDKERRIYIGSSTISALAALSGVLGILLICTAAGCYLWNRRLSTPSVTEQEDQRGTEMNYGQLQRQANEPTYMNADENYSVISE